MRGVICERQAWQRRVLVAGGDGMEELGEMGGAMSFIACSINSWSSSKVLLGGVLDFWISLGISLKVGWRGSWRLVVVGVVGWVCVWMCSGVML